MRYAVFCNSWTNVDWSDWDFSMEYVEVKPKHTNLKLQAAEFMQSYKWRDGDNKKLLRAINKKAKKIKTHGEKSLRSNNGQLLRYINWYAYSHGTDKYLYENI